MARTLHGLLVLSLATGCLTIDVIRERDAQDKFSNSDCSPSYCEAKRAGTSDNCLCICVEPYTTFDPVTRQCIDVISGCSGLVVGSTPNQIAYVTVAGPYVTPRTPLYKQDSDNTTTNLARGENCEPERTTYLQGYTWRTLPPNNGFTATMEFDNYYLEWRGGSSDEDKVQGTLVQVRLLCRSLTTRQAVSRCVGVKVGGSSLPIGDGSQTVTNDNALSSDVQTGIIVGMSAFVVIIVIVVSIFAARGCRAKQRRKQQQDDRLWMISPSLPYTASNRTKDSTLTVSSPDISGSSPAVTSTPIPTNVYKKQDTSTEHALRTERGVKRKIRFQGVSNQSFTSLSDTECDRPRPLPPPPGILRGTRERTVKAALTSFEGARIEQPDERAFLARGMWGVQHGFLRDMNRSFRGAEELHRLRTSPPHVDYYSDSELAVANRDKNRNQTRFKKFMNFAISAFGVESASNIREAKPEYIPGSRDVTPLNFVPVADEEKASTHLSDIEYGMFNQPTTAAQVHAIKQTINELNKSPPRPTTEGAELERELTPRLENSVVLPPNGDLYFGKSPRGGSEDIQTKPQVTSQPVPEPKWTKELFKDQSGESRNKKLRKKSSSKKQRPAQYAKAHGDTHGARKNDAQERKVEHKKVAQNPSGLSPWRRDSKFNNNNNNNAKTVSSNNNVSSDDNYASDSSDDVPIALINEAIAAFPSDTDDEENIPVTNIDDCCYEEIQFNPAYSQVIVNRRNSQPMKNTEHTREGSLNQF